MGSDRGLVILRLVAAMFTTIALGAGLAHLFALPNKISLPRNDYLTVQQIYSGWAFLGVAVIGALLLNAMVAYRVRHQPTEFHLTLAATTCVALGLVIFFLFTFPANQATRNWTFLPDNWEGLRRQWEYSHAVGAGLNFIALAALILSFLVPRR